MARYYTAHAINRPANLQKMVRVACHLIVGVVLQKSYLGAIKTTAKPRFRQPKLYVGGVIKMARHFRGAPISFNSQ